MNDIGPFAKKVVELHDQTDLNWRQVGTLLGVHERTVRWWATGFAKPVGAAVMRCDELLNRISLMEENTPAERRLRLLSSKEGMSLFHRWQNEVRDKSPIIQFDSIRSLYKDYNKD